MNEFNNKTYIIKNCNYFNLAGTLDCGQAFRWNPDGDGFFGVAGDHPLYIERQGKDILLVGADQTDYQNFWKKYFDMDFDYDQLIKEYSYDPYIAQGAEYAYGQRLLDQENFEALISFIISANNNVKRIKGIIERICTSFGSEILEGVHAFPTLNQLKDVSIQDYADLGAGYRADYLFNTVRMILDGFDMEAVQNLPYEQAKKELIKLKGVGGKVADCVLLYGYNFRNAFPLDVWVKRIVAALYLDQNATTKEMSDFAEKTFGENAGILQLFLFHYARNHKEEIDSAR